MKTPDHLPSFRKKKFQKKMLRGILLFSPVVALFCLVMAIYVANFYELSRQEEQTETGTIIQAGNQKETDNTNQDQLVEIETSMEKKDELIQSFPPQDAQQFLPADDTTDIYITPRMTYTLEIYDARSCQLTEEIQPIPTDMYGLNRVELEQYLIALADKENSEESQWIHHYQVTVFSRRAFTVRLTISEKEPEYAVFLIAEDGWLTAYTGDRTAVYEELHIALGDFPIEQQAMLTQGIYMKTLTDYYDFLETYSS